MRILLTGATGLIGRALGKALAARGEGLVCLVRDPESARWRLPYPATLHRWDHTREVPPAALDGVDAVVHLAGEPAGNTRWTAAKKALLRDSRVQGTQRLVQAVLQHGSDVRAFVHGSALGYWGSRGDEVLTAKSAPGDDFLARLTRDWEAALQPLATRAPALRVAVVRTGVVFAREGGALAEMLPLFRLSAAGRLGSGRQWMSWIHHDDIVDLFVHALDGAAAGRLEGVLEGVAPQAVDNRHFTSALCRALGVVENLPAPPPLLHLLFGERAAMVFASTRVEPAATLASGFAFRHRRLDAALADLLGPLRGGGWQTVREQWLPQPPAVVWPEVAGPARLPSQLPPALQLQVDAPTVAAGARFERRLRWHGLPLAQQLCLTTWLPPHRGVEEQTRGPFAQWHRTTELLPFAAGTLLRDTLHYRLPAGWLGTAAAGARVAADLSRLFDERARQLGERFAAAGGR